MNLASLITAAATGLFSGGCGVAIINALFNRGGQRATAAKDLAEASKVESEAAKTKVETLARDHGLWQEEAAQAYQRIAGECAACNRRLNVISKAFYELLDDLNDLDGDDPRTLRSQVRSAARKARAVTAVDL